MADVGKSGDAERQREIELADGTRVSVPYREAAQAQDDASRTFRDSGMGRLLLGDGPEEDAPPSDRQTTQ
jgi:hypothetical protein